MNSRFAEADVHLSELRSEMNARFAKVDVQLIEHQSEMNARFAKVDMQLIEQQSEMNARFAKVDLQFAEVGQQFKDLRADISLRFAEQSTKLEKQLHAMTRWLIGTVIALFALTITIMAIMLNVTVNVVKATGYDSDTTATSQAHVAPARSLHRFQRHHQPRVAGRDPRRHVLHAAEAQVFHPE
jgi:chromatin remodeling complex protein RSC6